MKDQQTETKHDEPVAEAEGSANAITELAAENETLKQLIRLRDARDELTSALRLAGSRTPALLFAYAAGDLQFDADGKLLNREAVVAHLKASFPEQFGNASAVPTVDGGAGNTASSGAVTRETLAAMSAEEISRLDWSMVRAALRAR